MYIKSASWLANSIEPDQMLHSAASDLGQKGSEAQCVSKYLG